MKINENNIGKVFQESLKDIEVQPDAGLWSSIEQQAGISSSGISMMSKAALYIIGAAVVVSSILVYISIDNKNEATVVENEITNKPIHIEKQHIKTNETEIEKQGEEVIVAEKQLETQNVEAIKENPIPENKINTTEPLTETRIEKVDPIIESNINSTSTSSLSENTQINREPQPEIFQPQLVEFGVSDDFDEVFIDSTTIDDLINNDSINIQFSDDPTICFGEDATLVVSGGAYFAWNTGANTSKIVVSPAEQSNYWVIVEDKNGNEQKHTFTVIIDKECTSVFVPSAFTPNGDGVNDVFKAEGVGVQSFEMIVINKEGQIVYESRNINDSWDGTYKNGQAIPRMYFYQITYVDAKGNKQKKRGQLTLIK